MSRPAKHIAHPPSIEAFIELLYNAPYKGHGEVVRALSAFLTDAELAELAAVATATIRGWRSQPSRQIGPLAADRFDAARVIAISRLRRNPSAWTLGGLGAWFRSRSFLLCSPEDVPLTPLEALVEMDIRAVMAKLMGDHVKVPT